MLPPDALSAKDMLQPVDGIFWKKCIRDDGNEVVLMMRHERSKDGRCDYREVVGYGVTVEAIYDMWGYKTTFRHAVSPTRHEFVYEVGAFLEGPIWGYRTFDEAQRKWVGMYGASKDDRYTDLATFGGRKIIP